MRRRSRNPTATRQALLTAGFEEVYRQGFQAASVERIVRRTELTKGAFFHHFPSKSDLGYAIVDELIRSAVTAQWLVPLAESDDPLTVIGDGFEAGIEELQRSPVILGCPLNNLSQEMSPLDPELRKRTGAVFEAWIDGFAQALDRARERGVVRADVEPRDTAILLVSLIEGTLSLAKGSQDPETLRTGLRNLRNYLETLRA